MRTDSSAASRLPWPGRPGRTIVDGEPGSGAQTESREIMKLAVAAPPTAAGLDEQLISRLMFQRIVLFGTEVDDAVANRLCASCSAVRGGSARRHQPVHRLPRRLGQRGPRDLRHDAADPNDVSTLALGLAGSMAQFLLCAGTAGKRFSLPHAQVLMHQGSAGFGGTAADRDLRRAARAHRGHDEADLGAHRPAAGAGRAGQHARPLVQRRGSPRLRARRHIVERLDDVRPALAGRKAGL